MTRRMNRRSFLRVVGSGAAAMALPRAVLAAGAPTPAGPPAGEPFFFLQMADPQLFWGPQELWEQAIRHANRLKPAFVVVCGDLTHGAGDAAKLDLEANEKMAQAYLETAAKLDKGIPLYSLAGNHDVCNIPTPETLAWYERRFGRLWYSFTHAGSLFLALDSNVLKHPDNVRDAADKQMAWLREALRAGEKAGALHKIVFMHHPPYLKAADEKEDYHNLPIPIRGELLKLFHAHGVRAVFAGHLHRNAYAKDGPIELVASCSVTKPLAKDPAGFRIVKVYADRIEHQYYAYADMPEKVELGTADGTR